MSTNKLRFIMTFETSRPFAKIIEEVMEDIHVKNLLRSGYFTDTIRKVAQPIHPFFTFSVVYIFEPKSLEDAEDFIKK